MEIDRNGLEVLGRPECLRLLERGTIGRLAVSSGALPAIFPVNYLLDRTGILVRTRDGTKLDAALRGAVVAFEVDNIDPIRHTGWSVCVTGVATVVEDPAELARIELLPLARWAPSPAEHVVVVSLELVSGRRIHRYAYRSAPPERDSPLHDRPGRVTMLPREAPA